MYSAEISRNNPTCFLFLVDQSGSMSDPFGNGESNRRKADALADAINRLLQNLVIRCSKSELKPRDYFHVGVVAYGNTVGNGFSGPLAGSDLPPISAVAESPARLEERTKKVEDNAGGLVDQTIRFPIWFDPVANGGTPMCQALDRAKAILSNWLAERPSSFPPVVINLTDGEATDGDPLGTASALTSLASSDGNVLLFNCHLSSTRGSEVQFPSDDSNLPDQFAKLLFQMSSVLPPHIQNAAKQEGFAVSDGGRGFFFNADAVSVIRFLDIGTRPGNLR